MALTDEQRDKIRAATHCKIPAVVFIAIEAAATAPLLERIAALETEVEFLSGMLGTQGKRNAALTAKVEHLKATASANYGRGHADAHSMQADQSEQHIGMVEQAAQPVYEVHKGEICYRSTDDDQSYGMWCPVHDIPDGTKLYTEPPKAAPLTIDQVDQMLQYAGYDAASSQECADFINGIRHAEIAHGIGTPAAVEKGET